MPVRKKVRKESRKRERERERNAQTHTSKARACDWVGDWMSKRTRTERSLKGRGEGKGGRNIKKRKWREEEKTLHIKPSLKLASRRRTPELLFSFFLVAAFDIAYFPSFISLLLVSPFLFVLWGAVGMLCGGGWMIECGVGRLKKEMEGQKKIKVNPIYRVSIPSVY